MPVDNASIIELLSRIKYELDDLEYAFTDDDRFALLKIQDIRTLVEAAEALHKERAT